MTRRALRSFAVLAASLSLALSLGLSNAAQTSAAVSIPVCGTPPPTQPRPPSVYKHVVWIIFENKSYDDIIGDTKDAPSINSLAQKCAVATNYYAMTHKSFQNYVAQLCGCGGVNGTPINNQRITWKVYAESMNKPCFKHTTVLYLRDHNATTYFTRISDSRCAARDVPMDKKPYTTCPGSNGVPLDDNVYPGSFLADASHNSLPQLSVVIPSQAHDMKGCYVWAAQIRHADKWLMNVLRPIVATPDYQTGKTTIFITFDEGWPVTNVGEDCLATRAHDCHIPTLVLSPYVGGNRVHASGTLFSHYGLLKTTEQMLGLETFLGHAAGANSLRTGFKV